MKADSGVELKHLMVDGGMTNGDVVMQIQADIGGFEVVRPEMRESTALGSALLAGSAVGFAGWDIDRPETLNKVRLHIGFSVGMWMILTDVGFRSTLRAA